LEARLARFLSTRSRALLARHVGSRFGERMHCRSAAQWTVELARQGFAVEAKPMSQGTPFANVLFVARKAAATSE
jgi:hypothetical protein